MTNEGGSTSTGFWASIHLTLLETYWPVLIGSAIACEVIATVSARMAKTSSAAYRGLSRANKFDWRMKIVSLVHSLLVSAMSFPILVDPAFQQEPILKYTHYSACLLSITCGYFIWDTIVSAMQISVNGPGMVVHGLSCFLVFLFSAKPLFHYYGAVFLMFELSTPFLNAHWILTKMGILGPRLKNILQALVYIIFFFARILFGLYQSFQYFGDVRAKWDHIPFFIVVMYSIANVVLNSLNLFWFFKMTMYLVRGSKSDKAEKKAKVN
ncbi:TLC domain-containing protein [Zopfochytrium polystomum]|nr:TLC domain-containing protein [Zopfochytrium polystomum]